MPPTSLIMVERLLITFCRTIDCITAGQQLVTWIENGDKPIKNREFQ